MSTFVNMFIFYNYSVLRAIQAPIEALFFSKITCCHTYMIVSHCLIISTYYLCNGATLTGFIFFCFGLLFHDLEGILCFGAKKQITLPVEIMELLLDIPNRNCCGCKAINDILLFTLYLILLRPNSTDYPCIKGKQKSCSLFNLNQ